MHGSPLPSTHVVGSDDGCTVSALLGSGDGEELGCVIAIGVLLGSFDGTLLGDTLGEADG